MGQQASGQARSTSANPATVAAQNRMKSGSAPVSANTAIAHQPPADPRQHRGHHRDKHPDVPQEARHIPRPECGGSQSPDHQEGIGHARDQHGVLRLRHGEGGKPPADGDYSCHRHPRGRAPVGRMRPADEVAEPQVRGKHGKDDGLDGCRGSKGGKVGRQPRPRAAPADRAPVKPVAGGGRDGEQGVHPRLLRSPEHRAIEGRHAQQSPEQRAGDTAPGEDDHHRHKQRAIDGGGEAHRPVRRPDHVHPRLLDQEVCRQMPVGQALQNHLAPGLLHGSQRVELVGPHASVVEMIQAGEYRKGAECPDHPCVHQSPGLAPARRVQGRAGNLVLAPVFLVAPSPTLCLSQSPALRGHPQRGSAFAPCTHYERR